MTLTVISNPVRGGDVTLQPASTDGAYYPYDNVTLTAVANPGYVFVSWTGDVAEIADTTQDTIVVAMDKYYLQNIGQIDITANFAKRAHFPWEWMGGGLVALLLAALALVMLVRKRAKHPTDTQMP